MNAKMKKAITKRITVIIVAAFLLLVNIATTLLPRSKAIEMSGISKDFLASLECDVEISVIRGAISDALFESFMKDYAKASERIKLSFIESSDANELLSDVGYSLRAENTTYIIVVKSDKRAQIIDYNSLFYYENSQFGRISQSQYAQYYQLFSSSENYLSYLDSLIYDSQYCFYGDALITGLVEYVTLDIIPRAYMVTSHGTVSASEENFAKVLNAAGYTYSTLSLSGLSALPEDAGCVIINEPTEDLTEGEADALLDYLAKGGRLLLVTDEAAIDMPNLMSITSYYGVTAMSGRVAESVDGADSFTVTPTLNTDHDVIAAMSSYKPKMTNANAIVKNGTERKSLLITPLVTSAKTSHIEGDAEKLGSYDLGVAIEEEVAEGTTRLVWFTGADSFNGKIDELKTADSLAFLVYSTTWLNKTYTSRVNGISAVPYGESVMRVPENAVTLGVTVILLSATAIIVVGVVVINRRKKR